MDSVSTVEKLHFRWGLPAPSGWEWAALETFDVNPCEQFVLHLPPGMPENQPLKVEFSLEDSAGNSSLPYRSQTLYYHPVETEIKTLVLSEDKEGLVLSWQVEESDPGPVNYKVELYSDSVLSFHDSFPGNAYRYILPPWMRAFILFP